MKNLLTLLLFLVPLLMFGQVTITSSDMPSPNDTFRISTALDFRGDESLTGANYYWDYSGLQAGSQRIDTFLDVLSTPVVYNLVFNIPWDDDQADVAVKSMEVPEISIGIEITDNYNFYASDNSSFRKVGFGATINQVPMPISYDNPEVIYKFPLEYQDSYSSNTDYEIDIPTVLFFSENIERDSYVDGWGTLELPMGSFDVLRIKSDITRNDSIYMESMGFGMNLPPITTTEYHWVGVNSGEPLLKITSALLSSTIQYQDLPPVDTTSQSINQSSTFANNLSIYPNPAKELVTINYKLKESKDITIELLNSRGKLVSKIQEKTKQSGDNNVFINCNDYNLSPGTYFIRFVNDETVIMKQFILVK